MLLVGLWLAVDELHRNEWLSRRIAVLQALKDRPTKGILAIFRNVCKELSISFDDEAGQPAFEIGFGFPTEFVAALAQVGGCRRRRSIGDSRIGHVLHPAFGSRFVGQPNCRQRIT